jgi:hypothetical protein
MSARSHRTSNVAATGCGAIVFFAFLTLVGLLVSGGLFVVALQETDASDWVPTPGVVRSLRIESDDDPFPPYRVVVEYRYDFAGRSHVSDRFASHAETFDDYGEAVRLLRNYVVGSPVTCFVNPANPTEAVLRSGRSPMIWFALLPLLFAVMGVAGLIFTIKGRRESAGRAKSTSIPTQQGPFIAMAVFGIFLVVGATVLVVVGLPTLRDWLAARSWVPVEATVVNSRVRAHRGDDSATYSVQVVYDYRVGDRTYRSSRDGLISGSSSGREGKEERVRQLRPGTKVTAYVDPNEPTNAMLDRSGWWLLLSVGLPGLFALIGAGGLWHAIRARMKEPATSGAPVPARQYSQATAMTSSATTLTPRVENAAPVELRPTGRKGTLVFLIFFALIWNGITWGFILSNGARDLCSLLFMAPFVLAGVGIVGAVIYQLLALANPKPILTLKPGVLRLGDSFQIDYRFDGRFDRITRLKVILEGREEATYTRGTKRTTDKQVFREIELLDTDSRVQIERGTIRGRVPEDTMHSLVAGDSRIVWRFVVKGTIERWPDVDDEFPVEVLPAPLRSRTGRASWLQ